MTKTVDTIKLTQAQYEDIKEKALKRAISDRGAKALETYNEKLLRLAIHFQNLNDNGTTKFHIKDKDVIYDCRLGGVAGNLKTTNFGYYRGNTPPDNIVMVDFAGFAGEFPTLHELEYFIETSGDYKLYYNNKSYCGIIFLGEDGVIKRLDTYDYCHIQSMGSGVGRWDDDHVLFPVHHFHGLNARMTMVQAVLDLLMNDLTPAESIFGTKVNYNDFLSLLQLCKLPWVKDIDERISIDLELLYKEACEDKKPFFMTEQEYQDLMNPVVQANDEQVKNFVDSLLECDYNRACLDRYDENILIDPNRGHWDLWDINEKFSDEKCDNIIKLPKPLVARNPVDDINSGIVAIDFGTKSTVVVYKNETSEILPLQVGSGNYAGGVKKENYENPTIVQFIDIESFMNAYKAKAGRPDTSYETVTVSSNAKQNLDVSSSTEYYSFFDELKQWCGGSKEKVKIEDKQGNTYDLPAYLDLLDADIDPIEIYAYYLGLYINNMLQEKHIFMHYIMSFPVNYERNIREKLLGSFARGLKKSLPTALLNNEEAMKRFKVVEGATEPAAYACTALREFGFDPVDEEQDYYGVFDFGGGTTDFDFGWLEELDDGRYDYKLTHFGENGDRTLGGENILKLLAFEVFAVNYESLLKVDDDGSKIPFCKAPDSKSFVGNEAIIRESREAKQNMHNLMEKLRPVWEEPESEYTKDILEKKKIEVNLVTDKGEQMPNFSLEFKNINLPSIIRGRIDKGINNFFVSLNEAFRLAPESVKPLSQIETFYIFMAGNASKSVYVKEIFDEYISGDKPKAQALLGVLQGGNMPKFKILPPLGTVEADKIINASDERTMDSIEASTAINDDTKENDSNTSTVTEDAESESPVQHDDNLQSQNDENLLRPTGKTGVAYGLLETCAGGSIKVVNITNNVNEEVAFQYYIGRSRKKKFYTVLGHGASYNQWVDFMDASDDFDILYTTQPAAANNNASLNIAKRKHIVLEKKVPDGRVFIKPVASTAIVYTIATSMDECANIKDEGELVRIDFE